MESIRRPRQVFRRAPKHHFIIFRKLSFQNFKFEFGKTGEQRVAWHLSVGTTMHTYTTRIWDKLTLLPLETQGGAGSLQIGNRIDRARASTVLSIDVLNDK
jgi:hypothetical protein